jgi:hypothetical protein
MKRLSDAYSFIMRSLFSSLYNIESCLFQVRCRRYFYIAVVVFQQKNKILKTYELFIIISSNTSFDEKNIFSICKSSDEYVALRVSSSQSFFNVVVARELVFEKTSELSKHTIVQHHIYLITYFTREIYCI